MGENVTKPFDEKTVSQFNYYSVSKETLNRIKMNLLAEDSLEFDKASLYDVHDVYKKRNDDDIYIGKIEMEGSHLLDGHKLLLNIGKKIQELFTLKSENNKLYNDFKFNVNNDSSFKVDVLWGSVVIEIPFVLKLELSPLNDDVKVECNSYNALSCISGNEVDLFKRIFVKIDNLPNDIREDLYIKRREYLKDISDKDKVHSSNKQFSLKH